MASVTHTQHVGDVYTTIHFESYEDYERWCDRMMKVEHNIRISAPQIHITGDESVDVEKVVIETPEADSRGSDNDGWISWNGENFDGPSEVGDNEILKVKFPDGTVSRDQRTRTEWSWLWEAVIPEGGDIVAYCIVK